MLSLVKYIHTYVINSKVTLSVFFFYRYAFTVKSLLGSNEIRHGNPLIIEEEYRLLFTVLPDIHRAELRSKDATFIYNKLIK